MRMGGGGKNAGSVFEGRKPRCLDALYQNTWTKRKKSKTLFQMTASTKGSLGIFGGDGINGQNLLKHGGHVARRA
jgi:hypothetical protein